MSFVAFGSGELIILLMYRRFASRAKGEISIILILVSCFILIINGIILM